MTDQAPPLPSPALSGSVSIHDAAKGLLMSPEPEKKETPKVESAPPAAAPAEQNSVQETEAAPAEQTSGEQESESNPEPETPPIAPPSSWNKDEREVWESLPRRTQEYLVRRDQEQQTDFRRRQTEVEESRRKADTEKTTAENERARYQQQLGQIVPMLQQQIMGEFADVKTPADYFKLCSEDPARAKRYDGYMAMLNSATSEQQQLQAQQARERDDAQRKLAQSEFNALIEKRPELKDRTVRDKLNTELRDYAMSQGYKGEEFDGNLNHRNLLILEKAMLHDRAKAKAKEAIAKPVPKVQAPGTAKNDTDRAKADRDSKLKRAQQTGDLHDWAAVIRQ